MLQVLEAASQNVFVPLTVGGGIREYVDADGKVCMAPNEKLFFFATISCYAPIHLIVCMVAYVPMYVFSAFYFVCVCR